MLIFQAGRSTVLKNGMSKMVNSLLKAVLIKNMDTWQQKDLIKNFILSLDFKQEANGNSGVFIRSSVEGTKISGWQVEIAPPGLHTGGIYESYGRQWLIQPRPEDEKVLKFKDWNHIKIEVKNDEVTSWLNDKKMVHLKDELIGKGEGDIALQIHSGGGIKIRFKNIKIKELK